MKYYYITIVLILSFLCGCGHKEGAYTSENSAYLYFSGNTTNINVSIDNGKLFPIKYGKDNLYTIEAGKHLISIYLAGALIREREVYVPKGISKEIEVQ